MPSTSVLFRGQPATAHYDIHPGQRQTREDPGEDASLEVFAVDTAHGTVSDMTPEEEEDITDQVERCLDGRPRRNPIPYVPGAARAWPTAKRYAKAVR